MEHIVTGCKDCPFLLENNEGSDFCRHPTMDKWLGVHGDHHRDEDNDKNVIETDSSSSNGQDWFPITPDWCPLNKEAITIIKK